MKDICKQVNRT